MVFLLKTVLYVQRRQDRVVYILYVCVYIWWPTRMGATTINLRFQSYFLYLMSSRAEFTIILSSCILCAVRILRPGCRLYRGINIIIHTAYIVLQSCARRKQRTMGFIMVWHGSLLRFLDDNALDARPKTLRLGLSVFFFESNKLYSINHPGNFGSRARRRCPFLIKPVYFRR